MLVCSLAGYSITDKATTGARVWEAKYGQKAIGLKDWQKTNPSPFRARFGEGTSVAMAKKWYVSLGPLGLQTLMFDRSWCNLFTGFQKIMPKELSDSEGLVFNNFEVDLVKPGSPADGFIKKGDLILGMNGELLKEAQLTFLDKNIGNRRLRGLEFHAGQLIDQAEGTGKISLTILRAPKSVKTKIADSLKGLRSWQEVQKIPSGRFSVTVTNVDLLRFKFKKRLKVSDLKLSNGEISYPVIFSKTNRMKSDKCRIPIPKGTWTLTGESQGAISIESINRVGFTPVMRKYIKIIEFPIVKIGSFGETYDPHSEKSQNYSKILAKRLILQQAENGSWPAGGYSTYAFPTSIVGLSLMALADPAYDENIRKAAHFVANQGFAKWAYPAGLRLMFLSEYYMRFKDPAVLKGIKVNLAILKSFVTADYVAGHGSSPGYGGSGYIGAGGAISCGLALAHLAGIASDEDVLLLDNMLVRVQQLAPNGAVPYGRGKFNKKVAGTILSGQGTSCATGPYFLAALIRGGATEFAKAALKRYGYGPWGTAENGHAVVAIHFTWGVLASANCSNKALIGSMSSALWQFTLYREFDGLINKNNSRAEYHNGDGVIGEPYWRTAGFLLDLNAYKRNLAITGMKGSRAKSRIKSKVVFNEDAQIYNFLKRNWFLVEAVLGDETPKLLTDGIEKLLALPQDQYLAENLRAFYKKGSSKKSVIS